MQTGMSFPLASPLPAWLQEGRIEAAFRIQRCLGRVAPGPSWELDRCLDFHFIQFVIHGAVELVCHGRQSRVAAPAVLLLGAGTRYRIRADPAEAPVFHPVHFTSSHGVQPPSPSCSVCYQQVPADLARDFQQLRALWLSGGDTGRAGAAAALHVILARLATLQRVDGCTPGAAGIQRVQRLLDHDPVERRSVAEMAALAGMSRSVFGKRFKASTGHSPHRYRILRRCQLAADLIRDEALGVAEAAEATGYPDAFSFSKQFKAVMGHPPSTLSRRW